MFTKVLMLTAIILVFSASEVQADVIHSTWVGGSEGLWRDAENWDPPIVPDNDATTTFKVTIYGDSGAYIELKQDRTVNQVHCYGEVEFGRWNPCWVQIAFADANGFTNHGDFEIWPNYEFYGNVTNCNGATLDFENIAINNGDLRNLQDAQISVEGEVDVGEGAIINSGVIIVEPPAGECGSDRTFHNIATGVITGAGLVYSDHKVLNEGEIYASSGSLVVEPEGGPLLNSGVLGNKPLSSLHINPAVDVNNLGLIEVNAGGGVAFDCNLVNVHDPNATIRLLGGTLAAMTITQSADANFTGFGSITGDVTIESGGKIQLTGPTNIVGDVNITANATLEVSDGTTLITGHTTNNGIIRVVNGDVIFQGGYSGSGVVQKD